MQDRNKQKRLPVTQHKGAFEASASPHALVERHGLFADHRPCNKVGRNHRRVLLSETRCTPSLNVTIWSTMREDSCRREGTKLGNSGERGRSRGSATFVKH